MSGKYYFYENNAQEKPSGASETMTSTFIWIFCAKNWGGEGDEEEVDREVHGYSDLVTFHF